MPRLTRQVPSLPVWTSDMVPCTKRNPLSGMAKTYKGFRFGKLNISIGDHVFIAADTTQGSITLDGYDIARIEHLYETTATDKHRAFVQWYSKPSQLPSSIESDHMDNTYELVEDHRKFNRDVSVESIAKKCKIINAFEDDVPADLYHKYNEPDYPVFICRYRLLLKNRSYIVVPVLPLEDLSGSQSKQSSPFNSLLSNTKQFMPNMICDAKSDSESHPKSKLQKKGVDGSKENISIARSRTPSSRIAYESKTDTKLRVALRKCSIDSDSSIRSPKKIPKVDEQYGPLKSIANKLNEMEEEIDSDDSIFDSRASRRNTSDQTPTKTRRQISIADHCNSPSVKKSANLQSCLEPNNKVNVKFRTVQSERSVQKRKARCSSSSEESVEPRSRSISPQIDYHGPPAIYKLYEKGGRSYVVKEPIQTKKKPFKKLDDCVILNLLSSDDSDSEPIFEEVKKNGGKIIATSTSNSAEFELLQTPTKRAGLSESRPVESPTRSRRSIRKNLSENSEIEDARDARKDLLLKQLQQKRHDASLRIKLRRSTEQSAYKIDTDSDNSTKNKSKKPVNDTPKSSPKTYSKSPKTQIMETDDKIKHAGTMSPTTKLSRQLVRVQIDVTRIDRSNEEHLGSKRNSPTTDAGTPSKRNRVNMRSQPNDMDDNSISEVSSEDDGVSRRSKRAVRKSADEEKNKPRTRNRRTRQTAVDDDVDSDDTCDAVSIENNHSVTPRRTRSTNRRDNKDVSEKENGNYNLRVRSFGSKELYTLSEVQSDANAADSESMVEVQRTRVSTRRTSVNKGPASPPNRRNMKRDDAIRDPVTPKRSTATPKLQTPSRSIKNGSLTPSMRQRNAGISKPETPLQEARARLHVSSVPKSLPCREEEFNNIYTFLQGKLLDRSGGCMYISGVPGTGKTATVNEVIRCLKKSASKGNLDNFDFIEINGMKLTEPRQAYVEILKQLTGKKASWEQAHEILHTTFTKASSRKLMTLLLVDELDILCNKRQDVVYNLLDWPAKSKAQLVVLTIANTMDLPERVLMGRVTSRLGLTRLTFQPYTFRQLQEIVTTRLKDSNAFKSEAIQLVARKVAAVSGDARRALDICRRATEIAETNNCETVTMQNVNQALTEMIVSAKVQAIKHCSEMERTFLQAVCAEVERIGIEEVTLNNIYTQFGSLCALDGLDVPTVTETIAICARLGAFRLLICEHSRMDIQQRILLNVSSDDVYYSMQTIEA